VKVRNWCTFAATRKQRRCGTDEADLSSPSAKNLARGTYIDVRSRIPGIVISGNMFAAVEDHMFQTSSQIATVSNS